jgi:hypothetical protein
MCMFCALVPMSAAVGAAADGKRRQQRDQALQRGEPPPLAASLPVRKMAVGVTGGFVVCAAVYHLVVVPHTGMIA